jgi:hypothetical protein
MPPAPLEIPPIGPIRLTLPDLLELADGFHSLADLTNLICARTGEEGQQVAFRLLDELQAHLDAIDGSLGVQQTIDVIQTWIKDRIAEARDLARETGST